MTSLALASNGKTKMRATILAASQRLCVEQGENALTIRNIAASVGVSPTIIYQHYHGKAEIMHDMQLIGFEQLDACLGEIDEREPVKRLLAMCHRYVRFATEHPWLYELLFLRLVDPESDEPEREPAFLARVSTCVRDGVAAGSFRPELVPGGAALQLWAALHGVTTALLARNGRRSAFTIPEANRAEMLDSYFSTLARGLSP
jgi:AcrR family transcriptional regulator